MVSVGSFNPVTSPKYMRGRNNVGVEGVFIIIPVKWHTDNLFKFEECQPLHENIEDLERLTRSC